MIFSMNEISSLNQNAFTPSSVKYHTITLPIYGFLSSEYTFSFVRQTPDARCVIIYFAMNALLSHFQPLTL